MSIGSLLVVVSSLAFGTLALFAHRSYEAGFSPTTLLMVRFAIAGALMLVVTTLRRPPFPTGRKIAGLLLMGGLYVGQSFTFFAALKYIPSSMVSLLLYLYPGIVTIAAVLIFQEQMPMAKWLAVGLAVLGSVLIVGLSGRGNPTGIAYGLGTAAFYSAYLLTGTRVLTGVDSLASSTIVIVTAAAAYALLATLEGYVFPAASTGWAWAVLLAIIPTFIAISTLLAGLDRIGPVNTSTLAAIEPLCTAILAVAFLGEQIGPLQVLGGACILVAVVILARSSKPPIRGQAVSSASV